MTAVMDGGAGLTNDQPGDISLGTITAGAINATGDSSTGKITGIILQHPITVEQLLIFLDTK